MPKKPPPDVDKLDRLVAEAQRSRAQRERGYRAQALKLYPWICARCTREFDRTNLSMLTVHHKDHNHDNNPPDGSNWELLCLYCHENEHARHLDTSRTGGHADPRAAPSTYKPFADLKGQWEKTHSR
ncbi:MAG: YajD family HNH nuclease [Nitrococcus mobilis]|nr:YajD family HNH nuclease [Nitrococcus mobilis]